MNDRPMTELRRLLEAADPVRHEPELPDEAAARIRAAMLAAAASGRPAPVFHRSMLALAAALVLMVAAGILATRRLPAPSSVSVPQPEAIAAPATPASPASDDSSERRQLQFATPGGTRIIWTLDPQFKLEGTVP